MRCGDFKLDAVARPGVGFGGWTRSRRGYGRRAHEEPTDALTIWSERNRGCRRSSLGGGSSSIAGGISTFRGREPARSAFQAKGVQDRGAFLLTQSFAEHHCVA